MMDQSVRQRVQTDAKFRTDGGGASAMTQLAALFLTMSTVFVTRDLAPVYAAHLRKHPLGAELRAEQLVDQLQAAAEVSGLDVALLYALAWDESGLNGRRVSPEGALGEMQLLPTSKWGRAWLRACEKARPASNAPRTHLRARRARPRAETVAQCDALNVLWGAYALRDALAACGGSEHLALGYYRTGRCVAGPRGARTLDLARWLRWELRAEAEGRS